MSHEKLDTYLSLCAEYYDLDKPIATNDQLAFYREYIKRAGGPILEPMCGTGNFLLPYTKEGFPIEGYDGSEAMLKVLERKSQEESLQVSSWQQLTDKSTKKNHYHLIFIPLGSLGLLIKDEDLDQALRNFYESLAPGGKLVFDGEQEGACLNEEVNQWKGSLKEKKDGSFLILNTLNFPKEKGNWKDSLSL